MKKFISFVMAGAMVASLVPATAFAKGEVSATAKVVDALEKGKGFDGKITGSDVPELQLKITSTDYQISNSSETPEMDVTVTLDNADFLGFDKDTNLGIRLDDSGAIETSNAAVAAAKAALEIAKEKEAAAKAAYEAAKTDAATTVTISDAIKGRLAVATADVTAKETAKETADGTVVTKKETLDQKKALEQTAKDTYLATQAPGSPTAGDAVAAKTAWDDAVAATGLAQTAYDDAVTAAATAADDLTAAQAEKTAAQTAYDDAVDAAVATAVATEKAAYDDAVLETAAKQTAYDEAVAAAGTADGTITFKDVTVDEDELEFTIVGKLHKDDVIFIDLVSQMDNKGEGRKATVSVDSKMVNADDLVYASILGKGLKLSVKKTVDVAEEEVVKLDKSGLKIESNVDDFTNGTEITLKLSKGFEFLKNNMGSADFASVSWEDDNEIKLTVNADGKDEITLKDTQIEAVSAKSGAIATITARSSNIDSASCEVAKVVDYKVSLTVDEDDDVPVIYSGVNADNKGITDDSDHLSLEVTAKETFAGAWSMRQGFNFNLPEGVYVTGVEFGEISGFYQGKEPVGETEWRKAFENAYQDGDHKNFEFEKRVFDDVDYTLDGRDKAEVTFQLELVADPTFEGEVKLEFEGSLVDKQEVTIAKFVKPYTVKAEQNDLIIDYRNTEIKTPIVVTEAEEGLWEKGAEFRFSFDKDDVMEFEDDATFEIDKDSELDVKDETKKGTLKFTIDDESDAAAAVTIKDLRLFMNRNIPAGAYDLEISTTLSDGYERQILFAPDEEGTVPEWDADKEDAKRPTDVKEDTYVDDVCDYSKVVKEAFVNVVTSGRDQDNLFTTKVVVPVGEAYLIAGENKVELDVAAYISDAGYTMLPVRAISKALGVNTNNVLWNAESRTVTIMYGQRIITMTVGQKVIYVNGSAIPSSAAPEIKGERTFLPLRDLGTALGVTDVTWDAATKTATLNGGK